MITPQEFIDAGYQCTLDEEPSAELVGFRQKDWEKIDKLVRHYEDNKKLFEAATDMLQALKGLTGHNRFCYEKFQVAGLKAIEKAEGIL